MYRGIFRHVVYRGYRHVVYRGIYRHVVYRGYRHVVYRGYRHVVYRGYRHVVYRGCTLMAIIERITVPYMYTMVNASFMTSYVYAMVISTCTQGLMPVS